MPGVEIADSLAMYCSAIIPGVPFMDPEEAWYGMYGGRTPLVCGLWT